MELLWQLLFSSHLPFLVDMCLLERESKGTCEDDVEGVIILDFETGWTLGHYLAPG